MSTPSQRELCILIRQLRKALLACRDTVADFDAECNPEEEFVAEVLQRADKALAATDDASDWGYEAVLDA